MKKTHPVSAKVRGAHGYCKHLRKGGKRAANKSTRRFGPPYILISPVVGQPYVRWLS